MTQRIEIPHGHRRFVVQITDDGGLELWLDGCLRKRREPSPRTPLYVWTNIELDWEEHHYVEVRFYPESEPDRGLLRVTVNGAPILEQSLPVAAPVPPLA